ncbi:GTP cyclohydrolase I [Thermoproteus tenax]|uniref:GTP cyclohydrolase I n=1 Tax=Thermoproteus tenax (strain ATCC 35583 / DSM 2078 / JCM 9277 / NBRC 100435 / Kra 1) TaxID=768679 RepID=G4RKJ8_THETK|nr:GTP cyclohydrolase I FolE [Thermoproteus tenax]CCC82093.1 GTP cyclohydrolase I [Thermoproteus tenax Kra 1]
MRDEAERAVETLLSHIGEDLKRPGLERTPRRFVGALEELTRGLREDPPEIVFFPVEKSGPVIVEDIRAVSLCEHHLLPIFLSISVAYLPGSEAPGLSKVIRLVKWAAARLIMQERFTEWLADILLEKLRARAVAVKVCGVHTCSYIRGVKEEHHLMITEARRGEIDVKLRCRRPVCT